MRRIRSCLLLFGIALIAACDSAVAPEPSLSERRYVEPDETAALAMIYGNYVARSYVGFQTLDEWYIGGTASKLATASREYSTTHPTSAEFFPGTTTSNDTIYTVSFRKWRWSRNVAPTGSGSCDSYVCATRVVSNGQEYGATRLELDYYLQVIVPVTVSITGPTSITIADQYTWTAQAAGGDANSPFTYLWEYRPVGGSWTAVGSGRAYSRALSSGNPSFSLRVTATSAGRSNTSMVDITVASVLDPKLSVGIDGPGIIEESGTYTWRAKTSGGTPPLTYRWQYCTGSRCWDVGVNGDTYTTSVVTGDPNFTLELSVSSSSGIQTKTAALLVNVYGNGGPLSIDP